MITQFGLKSFHPSENFCSKYFTTVSLVVYFVFGAVVVIVLDAVTVALS